MKKLSVLIFLVVVMSPFLHATATQECWWHAAYFDVQYVNNYGDDDRVERFLRDVVQVTYVVVRLDSLLKNLREQGKLEHFTRWELIDDYMKDFSVEQGSFLREDRRIYLRLTDSIAINKALINLWKIRDFILGPNKPAHMWLFSLHIALFKTRPDPEWLVDHYDIDYYDRPDSSLLWLRIEGDLFSSHHFLQHEKDGYYHLYTGLYLSRDQALEAKKLISAKYDLRATITSQYITPAIINKYAYE